MLKTIEKGADILVAALVTIVSAGMICVTFAQVFCRFVLSSPLYWSEELARYFFVYIVFLGGAWAGKQYAHLGVDYLVSKFSERWQLRVELLIDVIIIAFSLLVILVALNVIPKIAYQKSPAVGLSMAVPYSAIPIGFSLLVFYYILHLIDHIKAVFHCPAHAAGDREEEAHA